MGTGSQWRTVGQRIGGGGAPRGDDRCSMRGSEATERGEGVGEGIPPSHGRDFFQN